MRRIGFFMFFAVIIGLDLLLHYYLWARLVRDPGWPTPLRTGLTIALAALAIGLPLGMVLSRTLSRSLAQPIATVAFAWMGTAFILFSVVLLADLVRVLLMGAITAYAKLGSAGEAPDPVRREVIKQGLAITASAVGVTAAVSAVRSGLGEVEIREVPVKLERLPSALSGLTIVQLTDVHVGPLIGDRFIKSLVERVNALKPDAIVITGDLVDGSLAELGHHVAPLAGLKARFGSYFVTGNHEYYSGVGAWMPELRRHGIRVLRNEHVRLGDAGASIDLAGIDDAMHQPDLARALAGRDDQREVVLLAHQPKGIEEAALAKVGLQLSGHTHGGQIWPFNGVVRMVQPYVAGLHRHGDHTQIYVSRGTGFWGPPMRLFAPAEITKIILT